MKSLVKKISQALLVLPAVVLTLSFAGSVAHAQPTCADPSVDPGAINNGVGGGANCVAPTSQGATQSLFGPGGIFVTVTNILIFLVGAIAVIMLIVGGIRYVLSQGDQSAITSAKNTILYAIIGIVVAMLAFGAINFVTAQLQAP